MTLSEAGLVFSFFALIMFLLSPSMGSLVSKNNFFVLLNTVHYTHFVVLLFTRTRDYTTVFAHFIFMFANFFFFYEIFFSYVIYSTKCV